MPICVFSHRWPSYISTTNTSSYKILPTNEDNACWIIINLSSYFQSWTASQYYVEALILLNCFICKKGSQVRKEEMCHRLFCFAGYKTWLHKWLFVQFRLCIFQTHLYKVFNTKAENKPQFGLSNTLSQRNLQVVARSFKRWRLHCISLICWHFCFFVFFLIFGLTWHVNRKSHYLHRSYRSRSYGLQ